MSRFIYITEEDRIRLSKLINDFILSESGCQPLVLSLDKALAHACTVSKGQMPADSVMMHSTVLLGFDDAEEKVKLVFPNETDVSHNMISVLSPIGMAILGCKKGQTVEWESENKVQNVLIKDILKEDEV